MKKVVRALRSRCEGVLALEACVSMTLFIVLMLALYSLITLFKAQNLIGNALLQSSQSLALESYSTSQFDKSELSVGSLLEQAALKLYGAAAGNSEFAGQDAWFTKDGASAGANLEDMVRGRFCAYLAGGEEEADRLLRVLGVQNGLSGMDFSGSSLHNGDLTVSAEYRLALLFRNDALHLGVFSSAQRTKAHLWM